MSSPLIGASSASLDTLLPSSTTFHNASSISIKPSDALPLSSLSAIPSGPAQDPLTSSDIALDVAPITAQSSPTRIPTTTASDPVAKETTENSPTPTSTGGSFTAEGETPTPTPTPPIPTSDRSQAAPLSPSTSIIPTSSSIPAQISSSAIVAAPQLSTTARVSSSVIPTTTPSAQIPSSTTTPSQSQNQIPTPQASTPQSPAASETGTGNKASSLTPKKQASSTIPSQAKSSAAQPTDESVQGPQVFSIAAIAPSSETSTSTSTPTHIASSAASIQGNNIASTQGQPEAGPSQPTNQPVSASGGNVVPNSPASTPTSASSSIPLSAPASVPSAPSSTPSSAPSSTPSSAPSSAPSSPSVSVSVSPPVSSPTSTPISAPTGVVSSSVLSGAESNTITDAASPTLYSTGGVIAFPTAINTLPGDLRESGIPEGSQPTGQPIADPVSPASKSSTATIVGGAVGGIAAAAFLVILLWLWRRKVASGKTRGSTERRGSFKPMAQKFGIATTLGAVKQNLGEKFGSRNVNMNRGNSQFLEAVTVEPTVTPAVTPAAIPTQNKAQNPATSGKKPSKARKLGLSFDHGRLFNPFSDANALMSGKILPPSSSILSNPFTDDNMVLPPPVSAANRRSRGRSLGGIRSFQAPAVPPRSHSVHRESLQSNDSFSQRRDKFRSDPFDLELESQVASQRNGASSRSSSMYSNQIPQNNRDSYTSRYISGSSIGDWTNGSPDVGSGGAGGRRDSPTIS